MRNDRERDVERHLIEKCPPEAWCIKLNPIGLRGLPDRMLLLPGGRIYFIELKISSGRVSRLQEFVHFRLRRLGFEVRVLWSREEVDKFLCLV